MAMLGNGASQNMGRQFCCYGSIALVFLVVLATYTSAQQCGSQAGGKRCPDGLCCDRFGYCGSTYEFCDPKQNCQLNCSPGRPNYNNGRCGVDSNLTRIRCPGMLCCSRDGYCGATPKHCDPDQGCQDQCVSQRGPQCDFQGGCIDGQCCSHDGFCGSTDYYCKRNCLTQCPGDEKKQCDARGGCPPGLCCHLNGTCGFSKDHCHDHCLAQCKGKVFECGSQVAGAPICPNGSCCNKSGFCSTNRWECLKENGCQSLCFSGWLYPCGFRVNGANCPHGLCCDKDGFCKNTFVACNFGCQSQCDYEPPSDDGGHP